jgi:thiol-disulfide isomerase/thioredoxin
LFIDYKTRERKNLWLKILFFLNRVYALYNIFIKKGDFMNKKLGAGALCVFSVLSGEINYKSTELSNSIINFELLAHQSENTPVTDVFKQQIAQSGIVVVKFASNDCSVCRAFMPIFNEVAEQYSVVSVDNNTEKITYIHVDVDLFYALSDIWKVQFLPTTFFFKNGEQQMVVIGMQSKEILLSNITILASKDKKLH